MGPALDKVDLKLISVLQKDGRASFVHLGRLTGLRHTSVRERVLKLIKDGVIAIQANVNLKKLGFHVAFVELEVEDVEKGLKELIKMSKCPRVLLIGVSSGEHNIFVILAEKDYQSLKAVVEKKLRKLPGLRRIKVSFGDIVEPVFLPLKLGGECSVCEDSCEECFYQEAFQCAGCPAGKSSRGSEG